MRLREFSRAKTDEPPVLICAPYALHGALIADFAPGHSLVEALHKAGVNRVYVSDPFGNRIELLEPDGR